MTCSKRSCPNEPETTVRFPSTGDIEQYCDHHLRHLLEMGVRFEATQGDYGQ